MELENRLTFKKSSFFSPASTFREETTFDLVWKLEKRWTPFFLLYQIPGCLVKWWKHVENFALKYKSILSLSQVVLCFCSRLSVCKCPPGSHRFHYFSLQLNLRNIPFQFFSLLFFFSQYFRLTKQSRYFKHVSGNLLFFWAIFRISGISIFDEVPIWLFFSCCLLHTFCWFLCLVFLIFYSMSIFFCTTPNIICNQTCLTGSLWLWDLWKYYAFFSRLLQLIGWWMTITWKVFFWYFHCNYTSAIYNFMFHG